MEWISVEDRLPEPTIDVLAIGQSGKQEVTSTFETTAPKRKFYAIATDKWDYGDWVNEYVTHWMPLPLPPEVTR